MARNKTTIATLALGGLLTTAAFLMAFLWAPMTDFGSVNIGGAEIARPDIAQKIFYFHVPVAEASFLVFFFVALYGALFLAKKDRVYDTKARIAAEVTLMFVILTMISGDLWTKASWDTWWVWEPRLTTYFIMTLLVVAYFVLRNSIEDEERRATYAAVFGIVAFLDAPLSFMITRWYRSIHPVVIGGASGSWLFGPRLVTFIVAQVGMLALGYAIYQLRMREELTKERIEAAKAALEG
ncbi:MAG TPA: cytochrome c biogenesis protein [Coriobacteriia bacterium]|jgi:heme exporter protein C